MSTQLQEAPPLVSMPEHGMLFMSRRENLRLVKLPRQPLRNAATGQKEGETMGEVLVFRENRLPIPANGQLEMEDGRFIDAVEAVAWLERHKLHGSVDEGFWRVDTAAPAASQAEMEVLTSAATNLDSETLVEFIAQEERGWQREGLLEAARATLAQVAAARDESDAAKARVVEEAKAEARAEVAREQAKAKAKPEPKE